AGATQLHGQYDYGYGTDFDYRTFPFRYQLTDPQPELLLPLVCRTGRCMLRLHANDDPKEWLPLAWDDGEPWRFRLRVDRSADGNRYEVAGVLERGTERMRVDELEVLMPSGIFCTRERAGRFAHGDAFGWVALLREQRALEVPVEEGAELVAEIMAQAAVPDLTLPDELRYEQVEAVPRPRLVVKRIEHEWRRQERVRGDLS